MVRQQNDGVKKIITELQQQHTLVAIRVTSERETDTQTQKKDKKKTIKRRKNDQWVVCVYSRGGIHISILYIYNDIIKYSKHTRTYSMCTIF